MNDLVCVVMAPLVLRLVEIPCLGFAAALALPAVASLAILHALFRRDPPRRAFAPRRAAPPAVDRASSARRSPRTGVALVGFVLGSPLAWTAGRAWGSGLSSRIGAALTAATLALALALLLGERALGMI